MSSWGNERLQLKWVQHGSENYQKTVALRQEILRTPLGLQFSQEELEKEINDYHLAVFGPDDLIGCMVLTRLDALTVKMRQVAVKTEHQGKGTGMQMVSASEQMAKEKGFEKIILHARDTAVPFYLKLGYQTIGEVFTEVTIPHLKMEKRLI